MSERVVGSLYVGKSDKFQTGMSENREVSKTLMTGGECAILLEIEPNNPNMVADNECPIRLGNVYDERFGSSFGGCIWDTNGIAPTLKTTSAASQQFVIQKVGDRGTDQYSVQTEYANCIPSNPMSDREQMVVEYDDTND